MSTDLPDPTAIQLPATIARNEKVVDRDFWKKLRKVAGRIPFAEDAAAAYFCAVDPATPSKVKATLFAALAYFVMPFDIIPDFLAGIGYTDDAAVLALAISMVSKNITEAHRVRARMALHIPEPAKRA
ncbi:MAG TPA: YkvA family protein [Rhizomicrobium sp.]|nr:YkvA family protein [Rhizomicrobium sp.]